MSDRKTMIKELIEMQRKFIAEEQKNGIHAKDYFNPESGHVLDGYREAYNAKAMALVDEAHKRVGSKR
jgi:putative heme iron utilization protein